MFFKNVFGIALLFLLTAPTCLVAQENVPLNSISPMLDFTLQAADAAYFTVQDPDGSDGAPEGEDEDSKEAREALLEAYREILGPDDMLLEAYLEGGKGIIVIDDFWSTTEDYDYMFAQSRIEIDLSVLIKNRGMAWGVLTLRKRLLQSLNWDRKVRNHYIELLLARDPQRAERILNSIRWDAVQALMVEIETIIDRIGEGAEIIISFTDAGDIAVTIKDIGNDTPVVTKIFTAGAGMLPIVPGKVGKWIGDKINSGAKWVWRKISGKWRKAPNRTVVLGLDTHLDDFAKLHNGKKVLQLAEDPVNWKGDFYKLLSDPNAQIKFNLKNVDVWPGVTRASSGKGFGATDWELLQIYSNKDWWPRIKWFDALGNEVPNPFK